MNKFTEMGIDSQLIEKLKEKFITQPTDVQERVIPRMLAGKNVVFRSATGTGKTFAYLLPALQCIMGKNLKILICAPTAELCSQIKTEINFLYPDLPAAVLIGSTNIDKQIDSLKKIKPAAVAGNPGRLLTLARMKKLNLKNLRFLILDEADRLTTKECLEDTKELLNIIEKVASGKEIQTAACSATVSEKTVNQLGVLFKNAEFIKSDDNEILRERIEHWAIFSEKRKKVKTLRSLLAALKSKKKKVKMLVFTSKGDDAEKIFSQLQYHHVAAAGLFGKSGKKPLTAEKRREALDAFRQGKAEVLVATDLAARGLDIPGITHVVSMDVPGDSGTTSGVPGETYIHRCGRTGRAGKKGVMVTIGDETQMRLLALLEKKIKIKIYPKELYQGRICVPGDKI